ncbi:MULTISPECIES: DUF3301 domain-containing protein [Methylophaga]|uniref:DUF3301 domain-containing protein n=1 Tax=Methylophaga marina TaxID=45495 RepID=A0ABN0TS89_9GAMM|nr:MULTISPECIES: DUF3301 domain-containing protein [Methylophaga]MAX52961.1 hypothetical protein [Methylophaga sp.]BDZ73424.1 hypothetical protein GCM10025856_11430 [Methylophaga marina]|tara:strand:+ start:50735 stop:51046 length:312 start_codon:yes stop_codon:yes gene_type:complete
MNDSEILVIILAAIAWFWWDSRGVAERATLAAKSYCANTGVAFLNDTVFWRKIRFKRNRQGRIQLQRYYFFEFASDMQQRYQGEVIMMGKKVESIKMDAFRAG